MKLSTTFYLLAAVDFCLYVLGYNVTFFLGPFSSASPALLATIGYLFGLKEKSANYTFSLDDGESLVWSHTGLGVAFGLTNEKLLFNYTSESVIGNFRDNAGKNIKFPEVLETSISRNNIMNAGVEKNKLREVLYIELEEDIKMHLPIMGKKKDELLNLLLQESESVLPNG